MTSVGQIKRVQEIETIFELRPASLFPFFFVDKTVVSLAWLCIHLHE